MDLRQIRYFTAVAETGNFIRAAASLNISQPALSKTIQNLEQSFNVKLFERGARRVTLTVFGKTFYDYGKAILAEVGRAEAKMLSLQHAPAGSITIGSLRTVANTLLPEITIRFLKQYPTIRIKVVENYNADLINGLARGDFDFIIGAADEDLSERGLFYEPLCFDKLSIVARSGHQLANQKKISPTHLARYPWVLPRSGTLLRRRLDEIFYTAGVIPPSSAIESGSLQFIRSLLTQGDFLAILPEYAIRLDIELAILSILKFQSQFLLRPIGLIFHPNHVLPPACKTLVSEIRTIFGRLDIDGKSASHQLVGSSR